MADPQLENGYTRIADELLEALARASLSAREMAIVLAVVRKTYGFQKKSDRISASQISEATGIATKKIGKLLRSLEEKKILRINNRGQGRIARIALQKNHTMWPSRSAASPQTGRKLPPPIQEPTSPQTGPKPPPQLGGYNRERNTEQEREKREPREPTVQFGNLRPLLSPEEVDRWRSIKPQYSSDQVQAFYLSACPALVAEGKEPLSSARKLFASANPAQIKNAVLWVESQALSAIEIRDDRELDSFEDIAEAFKF